ncbi:MAG: enoyl-CoA hydratase/isomerase family protein [Actinomycetia bacterium]|nr:enoyl-CoA hydratase/isomerase family protein [Actinomycetes bacterium]MCP4962333.1 enoyl-CoA hydratase/isomerase family protein [Actinomycetes bacterium]
MQFETLTYEVDDHVAVLTYNRPEQHNAINRVMNTELQEVWPHFRDDKDAFVMVIAGAGRNFCAGWDLADAADWRMSDWDEFREYVYNSPGECGYTRRMDVHKPVIAAVQGHAVAAGLETAMLADIRIASDDVVFGALERRWNIVGGDGLTVRLPLIVGYARAMEMIITGREVRADEALRIGLVNEVVSPGVCLDRAVELAHQIAALPQGAIRTDKETVNRNVGRTFDERFRNEAEATMSMRMRRDTQDIGARAFKDKVTPVWPNHGL